MKAFYYLDRLLDQIRNHQGKSIGDYSRAFGYDPKIGDPVLVRKECLDSVKHGFCVSEEGKGFVLIEADCLVPGFVELRLSKILVESKTEK